MSKHGGGFLSLTRNEEEWLYFDGPCVVKVTSAGAGRARLAMKGPKSTNILRGELLPPGVRRALGMTDGYVER